jgi:hypothetical protein
MTLDRVGDSVRIGDYEIPVDPMDDLYCESCQ